MKVHAAAAANGDDDDDDNYNMGDDGDARGAFAGVGNDSLQTYEKSIELCWWHASKRSHSLLWKHLFYERKAWTIQKAHQRLVSVTTFHERFFLPDASCGPRKALTAVFVTS